ncbi:MAG: amino acid adenylation domain-containing protein [bacterium]|nr:amino acid adenylation domain-containing protein [bacterium]
MLLSDLFRDAVERHGERIAVDVPPGPERPQRCVVSYRELATMAAAVEQRLEADAPGVANDEAAVVAILLPRETPWLLASQLGVLESGRAYVGLDVAFPDAHLARVIEDSGAVAVLTDAEYAPRLAGSSSAVVVLPTKSDTREAANTHATAAPSTGRELCDDRRLAYLIYTSGTTGQPKGVMLEHRGVVNLIREGVARFEVQPGDRIAQGSSPAYDSSVEETWLALAAGATVVVLDDAAVRLGPDLVPWLRRERITILCPPPTLLRTTGCRAPREELPALRLCYVGGEPLSDDLVATWGDSLWLENGYGPTECTVTVVRGRVRSGEPVTIGLPVPPHRAVIVDEELNPLPVGEVGELCLAGPGLARGYLRREELTAKRFPTLPEIGRVYRTGDLARVEADGRLTYHGRIDAQVKVRGYRIELEAIEAVLARCEPVREAVCVAQGDEPNRRLVAHVVLRDPAAELPEAELRAAVARELPAYMVPALFVSLAVVPRSVGGKVDRGALPAVAIEVGSEPAGERHGDVLRAAFVGVLGRPDYEVADDADFFALGGDSLRAAALVTALRRDPTTAQIAVRDIYSSPTIAGLRALAAARAASDDRAVGVDRAVADAAAVGRRSLIVFTAVQLLWFVCMWLLGATGLWFAVDAIVPWLFENCSLATLLLGLPWLAAPLAFVLGTLGLLAVVATKNVLIGEYHAQRRSAWSGLRLRNWIVVRLVRLLPWFLVEGTELQCVALRLLGARIGRRVHLHRGVRLYSGGWDLLTLGDDVTLGRDVDLGLCELDAGEVVFGSVTIGRGATLECRAGTGPNVDIGEGAIVRPLSFVADGDEVPAGSVVSGVPARTVATSAEAPGNGACAISDATNEDARRGWSPWRYTAIAMLVRFLVGPLLAMPGAVLVLAILSWCSIDGGSLFRWLCVDGPASTPAWFLVFVLMAVAVLLLGLFESAIVLRLMPSVRAGRFPRWSLRHLWLTARMRWVERAGEWLSGTLFWPWWLRLAGMRIEGDVEVSSIHDALPEQLALGAHSFLADGVYLGVPRIHQGEVRVAPTALGPRTFVGNHVVVEAGATMPEDLLLGISTLADPLAMTASTSWFGHPAFLLPRREVVEVDRRLTHEPGPWRYTRRLGWEAARFLLPLVPAALALSWFGAYAAGGWLGAVIATAAVGVVLAVVVLAAKWLLLGRVRPGQHGLWSGWASRWDFHYVMWQRYARGLLSSLEGTLLLPWYLRAMGMRIGRACVLGDGFAQVVDPDMLTIEDGATVHALFQAHSFEDRVLKIDRVRIGRDSTVGKGAVLLYGADIGDGSQVMPHSVVMKHEHLRPNRRYAGAPTVELAPRLVT